MSDVRKISTSKRNISKSNQRVPQARKKKKRRKKNMSLYYLMTFITVAFALVVLSLTVFFRIDTIKIKGSSTYSTDQIIASSGIRKGDNLIRLDKAKAQQSVLKNLVNVDTVKISRKFPSEIVISVTSCEPMASIEYNGQYYVISKNGKIIEDKLSSPKDKLILIKGFDPVKAELNVNIKSKDPDKEKIIKNLISEFNKSKLKNITKIDISDRLNIKFTYQDRIDVEIGSSSDMEYKIRFITATIEDKTDDSFTGRIIMRGKNSASVIPK